MSFRARFHLLWYVYRVFISCFGGVGMSFQPGNQLARKARGTPKRPKIAFMLEQFAPNVIQVVRDMLNSENKQDRWTAAKEVLPYLWGKKSTVQVGAQDE